MEKLPMCRICLVHSVRMYVVANRNMQELYEKLTDIPFVTEDRRPMLACFLCYTKLKQCCQLMTKCLEAEELFAQMMNEDYELNPLINQDHLDFLGGFIISPVVHISIVDKCQTESIAVKEELPAVCEGLDIIIEPKEEHQSDELEPENFDNCVWGISDRYDCLDVADVRVPPHHSKSDLEDDVPLKEFKTEVEEEQKVSKKKRKARETKRTTVVKKPKLDTRRTKLEDAITAEQPKKEKSDSKVKRTTQKRTSKPGIYYKEPLTKHIRIHAREKPSYECDVCQRSFSEKRHLISHTRIHTGEKPYKCDVCQHSFSQKSALTKHTSVHTGEKAYKCDICQSSFRIKASLILHMRIHTGEKPYKCDVCSSSFKVKSHLSKHIQIHTGEKPFKCDVCLRSFRQKCHLTKHTRIHTGEKAYKCDLCQSSFRAKDHLLAHIRVHTGEKPYKCDVCRCSFRQRFQLTSHIRLHTGEKLLKCDKDK